MRFLEKDLEQIVYENLLTDKGCKLLSERGLNIHDKKPYKVYRQKKIGNYGIADLITVNRYPGSNCIEIIIYEFKKDLIDIDSLIQINKYIHGVKRFFGQRTMNIELSISGKLIGRKICTSDSVYLWDIIDIITLYRHVIFGFHVYRPIGLNGQSITR